MTYPAFSEFSFGFALTNNIMVAGLPLSPTAPVFPSLIAEGSVGGGYDVKIPLYPVPVFLQFKIPQVVRRRSYKMPDGFGVPYLRMHIRTKGSNQHKLLMELESSGKVVAYATPEFWRTNDLDSLFANQSVHMNTRYFSPSEIGPLDDAPHQVSYQRNKLPAWLLSDPKELTAKSNAQGFGELIKKAVLFATRQDPLSFLNQLSRTIQELTRREFIEGRVDFPSGTPIEEHRPSSEGRLSDVAVAARNAAYLSQVRLGCTLVIAGRNE